MTQRQGAALLAWALGVYAAAGGLPLQPAHELHLMLAQHWLEEPFSLNCVRFSGASISTAPPLFHLLVAAGALLPGSNVERAYAVLVAVLPVLLVWASARFAERLAGARAGDLTGWLVAASPLVTLTVFPFAQGPLVLGLVLAYAAGSQWLESGPAWVRALGLTSWLVAAAGAHPLAGVTGFALGLLAIGSRQGPRALGVLALVPVAALLVQGSTEMQSVAPIAEPLLRKTAAWVGGVLACSAVVGLAVPGWKRLFAVGVAATCVAGLAFGVRFEWLFVGSVAAAVVWALVATEFTVDPRAGPVAGGGLALLTAALLGPTAEGSRNRALDEPRTALANATDSQRYAWLSVGLGPARFDIARRVRVPSADLALPGGIDEAPPSEVEHLLMARVREVAHLKWIISARPPLTPTIERLGFVLRGAWAGGIALFERPTTPPREPGSPPPRTQPTFVWTPLVALLLGGAAGLRRAPKD